MKGKKSFTHRPFRTDDLKLILDHHREHVRINFPDSKYKRRIFRKQVEDGFTNYPEGMMVWESRGEFAGFLWLEIRRDEFKDIDYGYVRYVHVVKKFRGQGLGNKMMKMVDRFFGKRGIVETWVGTRAGNDVARGLYDKYGYVVERVFMRKKGEA